ncbi:AbgT family transporter [Cloacibacillus sp. An23]|uniref:YfcC family protein n=1 Tax=Cloacibacillus sp. An23 TaxID=1965591 RepID=UPI001177E389|nr:AbgT family transporter [Cloacibacillus sp. An23]
MSWLKVQKIPHTYVLIAALILLAAIGTYVIPAGEYNRVTDEQTGRTLVIPGTFHKVGQTPVNLFDTFMALPKGLNAASEIIFFVLLIGSVFHIINATGTINRVINRAIIKLKGREHLLVPATMLVISLCSATFGAAEETLIFIPIAVAIAKGVGYDAVVGAAMVYLGAYTGYTAGPMNPFNTGIAQGIAELPLFSGMEFRFLSMFLFYILVWWWIMRYAKKVKQDPTKSVIYGIKADNLDIAFDNSPLTQRDKAILGVIIAGFAYLVWGVLAKGYYLQEIITIFLIMGVICGIIGKLNAEEIAENFLIGAKEMCFTAICIGLARAIVVVLDEGHIMDSVINALAAIVGWLPASISAVGMLIVQTALNFIFASGSGQAATTMPILAPLGDILGVTRQVSVLAFQFGDGITNSISPIQPTLMAAIGLAGVPYEKWVKFVWPIMVMWTLLAAGLLIVATIIKLGPF